MSVIISGRIRVANCMVAVVPGYIRVAEWALIGAVLTFVCSCGGSSGGGDATPTGKSGVSLQLQWPDGYVYDPAGARLMAPSGPLQSSAPAYVTKVLITITGSDIDPIVISAPLDTLHVRVSVTEGTRRFAVLVRTNIGVSFTGVKTVTIIPGVPLALVIPLEINAPPQIERIDVSNPNPKPGDSVTVTAVATDMDPNDTLTYEWTGEGPNGTLSVWAGAVFTDTMPSVGGTYKITLKVDDGHGGTAILTRSITITNKSPVVTGLTCDDMNPLPNVTVHCTCSASDPENDPLVYDWVYNDTRGAFVMNNIGSVAGRLANGSSATVTCKVTDPTGNSGQAQINLNQSYYKVRLTWTNLGGKNINMNMKVNAPNGNTWLSSVHGTNTSCSSTPPLTGPDEVYISGLPPAGLYAIDVKGASACGNTMTPTDNTDYTLQLLDSGGNVIKSATGTLLYSDVPGAFFASTLTFSCNGGVCN